MSRKIYYSYENEKKKGMKSQGVKKTERKDEILNENKLRKDIVSYSY